MTPTPLKFFSALAIVFAILLLVALWLKEPYSISLAGIAFGMCLSTAMYAHSEEQAARKNRLEHLKEQDQHPIQNGDHHPLHPAGPDPSKGFWKQLWRSYLQWAHFRSYMQCDGCGRLYEPLIKEEYNRHYVLMPGRAWRPKR